MYALFFFFFKQKTAYEMRISDWSSDVCSSDLVSIHVWLIFTSLVPNLVSRPLHFAAALPWVFLFIPARNAAERWIGIAATAFGLFGAAWLILGRKAILDQYGSLDRKSTRLNPVTNAHLVCRLLLEKKKNNNNTE